MTDADHIAGRDFIVVVGASKTGTTGVYATIKQSLARAGHHYAAVFEPARFEQLDAPFIYPPAEPLLVKITMDRVAAVLPDPLVFERRVMTVRDPRDVLISTLLFRPLTRRALARVDDSAIEEFIAAIARKEQDPSSMSVSALFKLAHRLGIGGRPYGAMVDSHVVQRELIRNFDFHVVRYENFVAGDLSALDDYLGIENVVAGVDPDQATYGHISRSKEAGQFRNWFLQEDLERFNKTFADILSDFGYDTDVQLPDAPVLDPAIGSHYLRDRYRQRRRALATVADARGTQTFSPQALAELTDHAEDGDAWACLRVAQAHQNGEGVPRDPDQALHWARRSARLGLPEGMELATQLLAAPVTAAARRERRVWQAAATAVRDRRPARRRRTPVRVARALVRRWRKR